ncbi:MAG: hypothetical protein U5L96_05110 [Owenweeksia sp.]|nr:hypothetical protein [Owenweeksia sp.]
MISEQHGALLTLLLNSSYDPTFIPHFSALDIENGTSNFCITLFTEENNNLLYHDQIPPEIIDPLLEILETASNLNQIATNEKFNYAEPAPEADLD